MGIAALSACTDYEALDIQKPYTYDEQYYQNLRDYKKTDHEISYAYYEGYAPLEGVVDDKDPASWGERLIGLPDSIDIVNMWMGPAKPDYLSRAWEDMHFCQEVKGTRFVYHADAAHCNHWIPIDRNDSELLAFLTDKNITLYDGQDGPESATGDYCLLRDLKNYTNVDGKNWAIEVYARKIINEVKTYDLNGVDVDYEPNDSWWVGQIAALVERLGVEFGLKSGTDYLLLVDYFGHRPPAACDEYCNYFIQQAYSDQTGPDLNPTFCAPEKHIIIEQFGNGSMGQDETKNRLLQYAAMEPRDGHHKGGCGVYYLGRNYYDLSGIPYNTFRKAIQIMNPAVNK